jgi:hypothetical protein
MNQAEMPSIVEPFWHILASLVAGMAEWPFWFVVLLLALVGANSCRKARARARHL